VRLDFPDDYHMLTLLAQGQRAEFEQLALAMPDTIAHLRGYQLIDSTDRPQVRLDALHAWLQREESKSSITEHSGSPTTPKPQEAFGAYFLEERVGVGGFGSVFRARRSYETAVVAVKVFNNASYERLMREVEVLQEIEHKNIVKLLEHGVDDASKAVFLVMEYLDGEPLSRRVDPTRRLRHPDDVTGVLRPLLNALQKIHPKADVVRKLEGTHSLSEAEFQDLLAARLGIVHRDIKPDNIILVPQRGPVLIDFGISSRVNDTVVTMAATPGRLPPDFDATRWSPDVDLYQLGLSMAEAMTGVRLHVGVTRDDIAATLEVTWRDVPRSDRVYRVVNGLMAASRKDRFRSADAALRALRGLGSEA
jgi:serine/threonine-protein kinase